MHVANLTKNILKYHTKGTTIILKPGLNYVSEAVVSAEKLKACYGQRINIVDESQVINVYENYVSEHVEPSNLDITNIVDDILSEYKQNDDEDENEDEPKGDNEDENEDEPKGDNEDGEGVNVNVATDADNLVDNVMKTTDEGDENPKDEPKEDEIDTPKEPKPAKKGKGGKGKKNKKD